MTLLKETANLLINLLKITLMQKFLIIFFLFIGTLSVSANGVCTSGDCENGYGTFEFEQDHLYRNESPIHYTGEFKAFKQREHYPIRGWRHGHGICLFGDGSEYQGNWKNDYMEGAGKMIYADGSYYEGRWRANQRHGWGIMHYQNGRKVYGKWKNGVFQREVPRFLRKYFRYFGWK